MKRKIRLIHFIATLGSLLSLACIIYIGIAGNLYGETFSVMTAIFVPISAVAWYILFDMTKDNEIPNKK